MNNSLNKAKEVLKNHQNYGCDELSDYINRALKLIDQFNEKKLELSEKESNELDLLIKLHDTARNSEKVLENLISASDLVNNADMRVYNLKNEVSENSNSSIIRLVYNIYLILGEQLNDKESLSLGALINKVFINKRDKLNKVKMLYV